MSDKTYTITEEQWRTIERLEFAARILAAALPREYTRTPVGELEDLAMRVSDWMLFLEPNDDAVKPTQSHPINA